MLLSHGVDLVAVLGILLLLFLSEQSHGFGVIIKCPPKFCCSFVLLGLPLGPHLFHFGRVLLESLLVLLIMLRPHLLNLSSMLALRSLELGGGILLLGAHLIPKILNLLIMLLLEPPGVFDMTLLSLSFFFVQLAEFGLVLLISVVESGGRLIVQLLDLVKVPLLFQSHGIFKLNLSLLLQFNFLLDLLKVILLDLLDDFCMVGFPLAHLLFQILDVFTELVDLAEGLVVLNIMTLAIDLYFFAQLYDMNL